MLALALAIPGERSDDVLARLAGDLRHLVDLGEARLVALDAVAAVAHRRLLLPRNGVAGLGLLCTSGRAEAERKRDDEGREGRQRGLHLHGAKAGESRRANREL